MVMLTKILAAFSALYLRTEPLSYIMDGTVFLEVFVIMRTILAIKIFSK